jgi:hypothetical protein
MTACHKINHLGDYHLWVCKQLVGVRHYMQRYLLLRCAKIYTLPYRYNFIVLPVYDERWAIHAQVINGV